MYNNYYNKNCCVEVELNTPEIEIDLEMGAKGDKGDTGETGPQGPKGDKGDSGASEWGDIGGTLSNQTDLQNALDSKANASSIPTKTSDLTNDSNYQNATQVQTAINNAIGTALGGSY